MNFEKLKNNSRNILRSIGLIILALAIYNVVSDVVVNLGNSFFTDEQIEALSYYFFDTVICVLTCILLFAVYYFTSRKKTGLVLVNSKMPKWFIVPFAIIITLGMGLVSALWLDFAYPNIWIFSNCRPSRVKAFNTLCYKWNICKLIVCKV